MTRITPTPARRENGSRVLVTGAAGWTAVAILKALRQAGYEIVALDLPAAARNRNLANLADHVVLADIASFPDVVDAARATTAIIHLAVAAAESAYHGPDIPFAVNVKGTYNVFEAARRNGVGRIVLMSEAAVHLPAVDGEQLDATSDWRSDAGGDHLYDLTKRLQEEIAKDFCVTFGMSTVTLRAGHIVDGRAGVDPHGRPLAQVDYARGGWVCRYDLARTCVQALAYPRSGYDAFHVIGSREAAKRFDVGRTERALGFAFAERFDRYASDRARSL